ncbi:MAG: protein-glutamate O-methyltransferase CheR [Deltaproteobacteria bacterium]
MNDALFNKFRALIYAKAGINLSPEKKELLHARLGKRLRACKIASYEKYYDLIVRDADGAELTHFINSISTNFTSFFRELNHFKVLEETLLPRLISRSGNRGPLQIWSAACSSGEEPYTLAMVLEDYFQRNRGTGYRIVATDISTRVLNQARQGVYPADRMDKVPEYFLRRYFQRGVGKSTGYFRIKTAIRERITFQYFNLMERFPWQNEIDIIFCRNVMIYFDRKTQQQLVQKFYDALVVGGYLLIGHSESISSVSHRFHQIEATVFRK